MTMVSTVASKEQATTLPDIKIACDYLVVGAGTACLAFVDTVLTRRKDATFVIVDRFSAPGGHWTKAYPFVRLHQPSCNYGVNSLPLSTDVDKHGREPWNNDVRASGQEICEYYKKVVENFVATGRVTTFFGANWEGETTNADDISIGSVNSNNYEDPRAKITHTVTTQEGKNMHVDCTKVVKCESDVRVPSMRKGPPFPIDKSVNLVPLNHLPSNIGPKSSHKQYLVVGGGKSGVDTIIYLLKQGGVSHDQITWVVPRPAWYFVRDHMQRSPKPGRYFWKDAVKRLFEPILASDTVNGAFLNLEKLGVVQRVNPKDELIPNVFKGATLDQSEVDDLRKIKNTVAYKGRITSITANEVELADGAHSIPFCPSDTLVVDCSVDNTYGYIDFDEDFRFFNPHKIRLGPLTSFFSPSHTSSQIGFLESEYSDTESGDEMKNSFLYFARGPDELKNEASTFLVSWYAHMKTDIEFNNCPSYRKFVLSARTDRQLPDHHGGILWLLWAIFGPTKLLESSAAFREKMETGGFKDFPTNPLPGRTGADSSKHEANLRYPPSTAKDSKKQKLSKSKKKFFIGRFRKSSKGTHKTASTIDTVESAVAHA